jgi:hypothetical protein
MEDMLLVMRMMYKLQEAMNTIHTKMQKKNFNKASEKK